MHHAKQYLSSVVIVFNNLEVFSPGKMWLALRETTKTGMSTLPGNGDSATALAKNVMAL